MISGYDPNKSGEQSVKITYGDKVTNFLVNVAEQSAVKPIKPTKKSETPTVPDNIISTEDIPVEKPEDIKKPDTTDNQDKPEEKPTATLGVQDKKEITKDEILLISIAGVSMVIAILLLIGLKRNNVDIYVIEDGKVKYAGRGRINTKNEHIDITKYVANYRKDASIRLVVKEKVANKLDDKDIKVRVENEIVTIKIVKEDNKYVAKVH